MVDKAKIRSLLLAGHYASYNSTRLEQLVEYSSELLIWNKKINLVGKLVDEQIFVIKHIADSLALCDGSFEKVVFAGEQLNVLDYGTGAGLPGIPLAIMHPEVHFDLLDARQRRIEFIRYVCARLSLKNADMFASRVEQFQPIKKYDVIVCRAVSSILNVINVTKHCIADTGEWQIMKGQYPEQELKELDALNIPYDVTLLQVKDMSGTRHLVKVMQASIINS